MKHKKHHVLSCVLFALFFVVVGILVGKCARKCRKNSKRRCRDLKQRNVNSKFIQRTSDAVLAEIEKQEIILQELREELNKKKASEQRIQAGRNLSGQDLRIQARHPQQQVQAMRGFGYYQNYPQPQHLQQQQFYEQIPVGRPINHSNNSTFATDYPQL